MVRVSLRVQTPLLHPSGYPAAGPSTATLSSPHKPTGSPSSSLSLSLSLVLAVFLGVADRTRRSRACTHALCRYSVHTRTVPGFPDQIGRRGPPAIPTAPIDSEIKGRVRGKGGDPSDFRSGDHEDVRAN